MIVVCCKSLLVCIVYASAAVHIDCTLSSVSRIRKPSTVGWLTVESTPTRSASLIHRSSRFNSPSLPSSLRYCNARCHVPHWSCFGLFDVLGSQRCGVHAAQDNNLSACRPSCIYLCDQSKSLFCKTTVRSHIRSIRDTDNLIDKMSEPLSMQVAERMLAYVRIQWPPARCSSQSRQFCHIGQYFLTIADVMSSRPAISALPSPSIIFSFALVGRTGSENEQRALKAASWLYSVMCQESATLSKLAASPR
jgi:hypothetical protein